MTAVLLDETLGRFALTPRTRTDVTAACRDAATGLGADGLGVALSLPGTLRVLLGASGPAARLLEQAELAAGEGPGTQAAQTGTAVHVHDLTDLDGTRWPTLARHLAAGPDRSPVRSVLSLPITDGRHTFGSVTLHSADPGRLDDVDLVTLRGACTRAASIALRANPGEPDQATKDWLLIGQAVQRVCVALRIDPTEATSTLRAAALRDRVWLIDAARAVLDGPALTEPRVWGDGELQV